MEDLYLVVRICLFVLLWLPMVVVLSNNRANAIIQNQEFQISSPDKLRIYFSFIIVIMFSSFLILSFFIESISGQTIIIGLSSSALIFLVYAWSNRGEIEILETHFKELKPDEFLKSGSSEYFESAQSLNNKLKVVRIGTEISDDLICNFQSFNLISNSPLALSRFIEDGRLKYSENSLKSFLNGNQLSPSNDRIIFRDRGNSTNSDYNLITTIGFICFAHKIDVIQLFETSVRKSLQEDFNIILKMYFMKADGTDLPTLKGSWFKNNNNLEKVVDYIESHN